MKPRGKKINVRRPPGRPRKYTLSKGAYEKAVRGYQTAQTKGRPRRKVRDQGHEKKLRCIECEKLLPVTEFWFSDARKLYFESMCKFCKRKYVRERKKK